jgi:CBS domain-containing protein
VEPVTEKALPPARPGGEAGPPGGGSPEDSGPPSGGSPADPGSPSGAGSPSGGGSPAGGGFPADSGSPAGGGSGTGADRPEAGGLGQELSTPVGALVVRPPLFIPPQATVAEAARIMREAKTSSALVADDPPGIVTDGDLRNRVLAEELTPVTPVRAVMSRPLRSLPVDTPLYAALLLMLDEDFEHVPVTREGRIVGMVTDMDLLRQQARSPLLLLGRIRTIDRLQALEGYSREIAATSEALFSAGVEPVRIARVIASLNDALSGKLLRLAEAQLGPPPCPYAWLALGSEGRMEQVLLSDQDNALVYRDDTPVADAYFQALAEHVVSGLLRAGFPPCPGGYMATNWRRPLAAWQEVFWRWVQTPEPQALLEAEVFLDFRHVHGELSPAPLNRILLAGAGSRLFLMQLARAATQFGPPLGPFGRIRAENGHVDLKRGGIAAIVLLGRVYSLTAGSLARPTLDRLEAAAAAGRLSRGGAEKLADTFRFLMRIRLREQLRSLATGREPENRVRVDDLSPLEQRRLRDAFRAVAELQKATSMRFRTQ